VFGREWIARGYLGLHCQATEAVPLSGITDGMDIEEF